MASTTQKVEMDARKLGITAIVHLDMKNMFWLRLGLFFIKIGCLIAGIGYEEE